MQNEKFLRHITLTTGHARDSYRSEVSDEAVKVCGALIGRLAGSNDDPHNEETYPFPSLPGYWISGQVKSRAMLATVWADKNRDMPVLAIGIAMSSKAGASLWRALHRMEGLTLATSIDKCPPEPWVAAAPLPGAALASRSAMMILGDFERCLGWAFIERRKG